MCCQYPRIGLEAIFWGFRQIKVIVFHLIYRGPLYSLLARFNVLQSLGWRWRGYHMSLVATYQIVSIMLINKAHHVFISMSNQMFTKVSGSRSCILFSLGTHFWY